MTPKQAKTISLLSTQAGMKAEEQDLAAQARIRDSLASEDELCNLTMAYLGTAGNDGATDKTITEVLNKVLFYRFMATCSELAAKGLVDIHYDPTKEPDEQLRFTWSQSLSAEATAKIRDAARRIAKTL